MKVYRFRVFGYEIAALEIDEEQATDATEAEPQITGGTLQNFERDTAPASPEDRYREEWGSFGFTAQPG